MPSITFSEQALKTWIQKYRSGGHDTQQIGSAASLEAKYGHILRQPPYSDAVTARLLFHCYKRTCHRNTSQKESAKPGWRNIGFNCVCLQNQLPNLKKSMETLRGLCWMRPTPRTNLLKAFWLWTHPYVSEMVLPSPGC